MSKQSSVDWLIGQVEDFIGLIPSDIIQQSKQMHKEELAKTWDDAIENLEARGGNKVRAIVDFDEYYNERFE